MGKIVRILQGPAIHLKQQKIWFSNFRFCCQTATDIFNNCGS